MGGQGWADHDLSVWGESFILLILKRGESTKRSMRTYITHEGEKKKEIVSEKNPSGWMKGGNSNAEQRNADENGWFMKNRRRGKGRTSTSGVVDLIKTLSRLKRKKVFGMWEGSGGHLRSIARGKPD